nr:hypothetical protein [Candidatus Sigynarchaeota archaeon]
MVDDGEERKQNNPDNNPTENVKWFPVDFWRQESNDDSPVIVEVTTPVEKGKCIVCYKPIFETDADLFKCPNCGREAHYLCATIFITEHEICPVCQNRLIKDKSSGKFIVVKK